MSLPEKLEVGRIPYLDCLYEQGGRFVAQIKDGRDLCIEIRRRYNGFQEMWAALKAVVNGTMGLVDVAALLARLEGEQG